MPQKRVTITRLIDGQAFTKSWTIEKPVDYGAAMTDKRLDDLATRLRAVYQQAADDVYMKQMSFQHAHEERVIKYLRMVEAGELSKTDYEAWMRGQVFQSEAWAMKRGQLARIMVDADQQALAMVNDGKYDVFADNANWIGFQIDQQTGGAAAAFGLYDRDTVTRLVRDQPHLLPMPEIDEERDYAWYNRVISDAVTQGILQGEALDEIVLRVAEDTGDKALHAMRRNARTAYTGAQNAGRMEGMRQARDELGLTVRKMWIATLDSHTRDSHADLDGQTVDIDEPFDSMLGPIQYPGDPDAEPANVYNCRCALGEIAGKSAWSMARRDAETGETVEDMTYREWMERKAERGEGTSPSQPAASSGKPQSAPQSAGKSGLTESVKDGTMKVSTGGRRNEMPLTERQKNECLEIAGQYGMPKERIVFSDDMYTGYFELGDKLYIGTDVYPAGDTSKANYMISHRGTLAHELTGHRDAALAGRTQAESYLEEAQASVRASKAPGLSKREREILLKDAEERLPQGMCLKDIITQLYLEVK